MDRVAFRIRCARQGQHETSSSLPWRGCMRRLWRMAQVRSIAPGLASTTSQKEPSIGSPFGSNPSFRRDVLRVDRKIETEETGTVLDAIG
eukprot:scaffold64_cov338-Pavlova_lutheri.AAC.11